MKHVVVRTLAVIGIGLLTTAATPVPDGPPVAPVRAVTDEHWGVKVVDPYRYMEDFKSPELQSWVKGQADYARATLDKIPGREQLLARIRELDEGAPWRLSVVRRWPNGDLHYLKRLASENLDKLYFRPAGGQERLLIDPEKLSGPGGGHVSIAFAVPSPDAQRIAYGLAESGSEQTVLRVLDVASGADLPDVIDRMEADYTQPCWLPDSSGFVYSRRQKLPPGAPATEGYKNTKAFVHRLGTDADRDPLVFAMGTSPAAEMTEVHFPSIVLTHGSPYAIGKVRNGDAVELTLYAAPVEDIVRGDAARVRWQKICDPTDQVRDFVVHGGQIFLASWKDAPRYRVLRQSLDRPGFASAETVVPAGNAVVESVAAAADALYVGLMEGAVQSVLRVPYDPGHAPKTVALPTGETGAYISHVESDVDGVLLTTVAWTRGGRTYAYDPRSDSLTDTGLRAVGKFDAVEGFESREVMVTSHDGVQVPLSIMYKSGITLDGSHPTLVIGYGAYGMTMYPGFRPTNLAWLERGGVIAIAHVRGGGEFGREWHEAGKGPTKPNTWKDFIACCQWLVNQKYTSPAKLAGTGGSAGGILIGRAITDRPDLFAAAIIGVGCTDAIRMETTTNGVPNIPEFGTVKDRTGFAGLLEMSAYAHVKDGERYPAVLLVHGINDPRVEPWMSAKMTARLQAASASGKPVLFRVDYEAGHGIGSTKRQRQEQLADEWAFALWQMGEMPGGR